MNWEGRSSPLTPTQQFPQWFVRIFPSFRLKVLMPMTTALTAAADAHASL